MRLYEFNPTRVRYHISEAANLPLLVSTGIRVTTHSIVVPEEHNVKLCL